MDGDVRLTTDVLGCPDMHQDPEWDGKCEFFKAGIEKAGPNTASLGELIASFEDPTRVWTQLIIDGIPISQVLEESTIITWDEIQRNHSRVVVSDFNSLGLISS